MNFNFLKTYSLWWGLTALSFLILSYEFTQPVGDIYSSSFGLIFLSGILSIIFTFFHKWILEVKFKKFGQNTPVDAGYLTPTDNLLRRYIKFLKFSGVFFFVSYVLLEILSVLGYTSFIYWLTLSVPLTLTYLYVLIENLPNVNKEESLDIQTVPNVPTTNPVGWHMRGFLINRKTVRSFLINNIGTVLFTVAGAVIILHNLSAVVTMLLGQFDLFDLREVAGWTSYFFYFFLLPVDVVALIVYFYAHQRGKIPSLLFNVFSYTLVGIIAVPVLLIIFSLVWSM